MPLKCMTKNFVERRRCLSDFFTHPVDTYIIVTRLLGHFRPIFYFNCEHFLFVKNYKTKTNDKILLIL